ncbi:hypothetical protein CI1B_58990 [Bradyrhizobium ivorense]|uniref:Uncharacterized protein n=1 Tax=Bradyrhizobium ivorense TaxID=2511166 RepID=A0A508TLY7_9BRAD|nr:MULTISPECIES: hypothetical protein [Bradyrhizobium]VIO73927.1 hypothetical protein CI41S_40370 [Bradyrhizobium ivorense]VIO75394.1 hypothetical protein CI1B_58990 [Bradyrhizobium ivorense]
MSNRVEDVQMLRLAKAFYKIKSSDVRRAVVQYVEEQLEKEEREEKKRA